MKRSIFFVCVVLLMTGRVFSQTENDFEVTLTKDSEGVVITKYIGAMAKTITIPATMQDMPVRKIGESVFRRLGRGTVTHRVSPLPLPCPEDSSA